MVRSKNAESTMTLRIMTLSNILIRPLIMEASMSHCRTARKASKARVITATIIGISEKMKLVRGAMQPLGLAIALFTRDLAPLTLLAYALRPREAQRPIAEVDMRPLPTPITQNLKIVGTTPHPPASRASEAWGSHCLHKCPIRWDQDGSQGGVRRTITRDVRA